jgi:hypothetical protein
MFSGGEKNSFHSGIPHVVSYVCSVIGNDTIATLAEKNYNFTCTYKVLRYLGLKVHFW